jgi:MFS family permease
MATTDAAAIASALLVAWAVGGPVFGALSDRLCRRKLPYIIGCSFSTVGWALLLLVPALPLALLVALILVTGFASGCMIISFAYAKESVPAELAGTVSGLINTGVILGPTILQPAVGWMLDRHWQGAVADGIRVYSLAAYRAGFLLMVAWAILALVLLFFTRETACAQSPTTSGNRRRQ